MIPHLPRCKKLTDPTRYACNCGADQQNALTAKLDAADPLDGVARFGPPDTRSLTRGEPTRGDFRAPATPETLTRAEAETALRALDPTITAVMRLSESRTWARAPAILRAYVRGLETPLTASDEAALLAFRAGQAVTRDLLATDAGAAARVTEDELAEIERAAKQIRDGNWPPPGAATILLCERTSDLADEVRALRGERDQSAHTIAALQAERESENEGARRLMARVAALESELAARPAPAADASLEARGKLAADAFAEAIRRSAEGEAIEVTSWLAVVRAVDASRPGLTEEQADAIALGCLQVRADLQRHAIKRAILRVDRGETGPTAADPPQPDRPSGLTCPGCYAATGIAQPHREDHADDTTTKDPSQ